MIIRNAHWGGGSWTNGLTHRLAVCLIDIVVEAQSAAKHLSIDQVSIEDYIGNIGKRESLVI